MWVLVSKIMQKKIKKLRFAPKEKWGNLTNLIISSQDGKVAGCYLSFLGAADV